MLTQPQIVPAPPSVDPSTGVAPSRRHRWWSLPLAVLGLVAIAVPLVAEVVPARAIVSKERCTALAEDGTCTERVDEPVEFALVPADAEPVAPLLEVTGTETFATSGDILFVTIREPRLTLLDWFVARNNPATRLRSAYEKFGGRTEVDLRRLGQRQMSGSKEWAVYVALRRAGLEAEFVPGPAIVDYVLCLRPSDDGVECLESPPSAEFLQPNDVVVGVDDVEIETLNELGDEIGTREVGDVVTLRIERDGRALEAEVALIAAPDEPERPIIGFMPIDTSTLQLPDGVSVDIATGSIGGPSAGLAFTLTLLDRLTPGSLTGGRRVAVTGAIDRDGNVLPIGGLTSKASAVQQVGARWFLVPTGQPETGSDSIAAAQAVVGDAVTLVPVATLEEALAFLASIGGESLPAPGG